MSKMYEFGPDDGAIKRVLVPGDYMQEITSKVVQSFARDGATFDNTFVCPNAWAVNDRDPHSQAVDTVWRFMLETIAQDEDRYGATLPLCLRDGRSRCPTSLIFFGNTDIREPSEIEVIRLEIAGRVNPLAQLEGLEL